MRVIVVYKGGFGGEYICSLLHEAILKDKNTKDFLVGFRNRYNFTFDNSFFILDYLIRLHFNNISFDQVRQQRNLNQTNLNLIKKYYGKDLKVFCDDKIKQSSEYQINKIHLDFNVNLNFEDIIPGNKVIVLDCDQKYYGSFMLLFLYKTMHDRGKPNFWLNTKQMWIDRMFNMIETNMTKPHIFNGQYRLDVFDLFYNDKNINTELSNFLKTKVQLKPIKDYGIKNKRILKDFFDYDLEKNYTSNEIKNKVLEFIDENY